MDRYVCLKKSDVIVSQDGDDVSSSSEEEEDDDDDDGDDSDEDEEDDGGLLSGEEEAPEPKEAEEEVVTEPVGAALHIPRTLIASKSNLKVSLRDQATAFIGVSKDTKRSEEDIISTPLPGETLAVFYARSRTSFPFWQRAIRSHG